MCEVLAIVASARLRRSGLAAAGGTADRHRRRVAVLPAQGDRARRRAGGGRRRRHVARRRARRCRADGARDRSVHAASSACSPVNGRARSIRASWWPSPCMLAAGDRSRGRARRTSAAPPRATRRGDRRVHRRDGDLGAGPSDAGHSSALGLMALVLMMLRPGDDARVRVRTLGADRPLLLVVAAIAVAATLVTARRRVGGPCRSACDQAGRGDGDAARPGRGDGRASQGRPGDRPLPDHRPLDIDRTVTARPLAAAGARRLRRSALDARSHRASDRHHVRVAHDRHAPTSRPRSSSTSSCSPTTSTSSPCPASRSPSTPARRRASKRTSTAPWSGSANRPSPG